LENKEREKEREEGDGGGRCGESGRGGKINGKIEKMTVATGSSSHSPSPDCRTRCYVSACVRYGMDSWPSRKSLKKRKQRRGQTDLDIQLPEVIEEHFDPVVVLGLVQDDKLGVYFPLIR